MQPIITSRSNPRIKHLRTVFAATPRPGTRAAADTLIAIEGEHLITEAIRSGLHIDTVFLAADANANLGDRLADEQHVRTRLALPQDAEILPIAEDVFRYALPTESPQGIAALVRPRHFLPDDLLTGTPLVLVAAGLQDPGNLGTLIRTAEAFGATGVLTTPGTVSPFNQKALRASAGSVFRVPTIAAIAGDLDWLRSRGLRLLAAVATGGIPAHQSGLFEPCAILIGNEGAGLSPELLALSDERITLPTPGPVESLNAAIAGSLLLYEASRQRTAHTQTKASAI